MSVFTQREKHVLFLAVVALLFVYLINNQQFLDEHELFWLFFVVAPVGLYIATDPERRMAG